MPWPSQRKYLSQRVPRLEGAEKVTGRAKYAYDVTPPGMLQAFFLTCPYGAARVVSADAEGAKKMPGVKAVRVNIGAGQQAAFHGQKVAVVVAETWNQARAGAMALDVKYEVIEPVTDERNAFNADGSGKLGGRRGGGGPAAPQVRGNIDQALGNATTVAEGDYRCEVVVHSCLEPHGGSAMWDGDKLTVWASTQGVYGVREALARQVPPEKLDVICEHMGGGFGSKLGMDEEISVAAQLSKDVGAPVKALLDRDAELTSAGCRELAVGHVKVGLTRDGQIAFYDSTTQGSGGRYGGGNWGFPMYYNVAATRRQHTDFMINAGSTRAFRAPGHPSGCFFTEVPLEAAITKAGLDPVEVRKKNCGGWHQRMLGMGADKIGWSQRKPTGSQTGRFRTGYGCALTDWGGGPHQAQMRLEINADGSVHGYCATQDIGTGTRTAMAVVACETLGLAPTQITMHIGHGSYPPAGGSGGSTTIGAVSSATRTAAEQVRDQLAARIAPVLGCQPGDVAFGDGKLSGGGKGVTWADACRRLGADQLTATAGTNHALTSGGAPGCHFAKVTVDAETGIVHVEKVIAYQNCGLIVNRLTCESQVYGGVVLGVSQALFEQRVLDPKTGRMLNSNLEWYKLAGVADVPDVEVILVDDDRGVIGVGEPPAVPTPAAVCNAVFNAVGTQITSLPITPDKVLAALATPQK